MSDLPADAKSDTASARGCTATAAGSFSRNGSVLAPLRLTADIHAAVHSIAAELDRSPSWVHRLRKNRRNGRRPAHHPSPLISTLIF
jgi:hypothetical protein